MYAAGNRKKGYMQPAAGKRPYTADSRISAEKGHRGRDRMKAERNKGRK